MPRSLQGKSAIVTGAGSGINLEFARLLLENGVNVLFADLAMRPEAQELLQSRHDSPKAIFQKTDVSSWTDLIQMFDKAKQEFGSIDIVCPGAGVFEPPFSSFWYPPGTPESKDDPAGDRYKSIDINLTHPIRVTQMAISHFLDAKPAPSQDNPKFIVHITSIAAQIGSLTFPLYHATKWGVAGFIHSMADMDNQFGIRVTGVAPGIVKTPLFLDNPDKTHLVTQDGKVQDSWITPQQVAEKMLALVTEDEIEELGGAKVKVEGGLILEIGGTHIRKIPMLGNPGPPRDRPGMSAINLQGGYDNALNQLRSPGWGKNMKLVA